MVRFTGTKIRIALSKKYPEWYNKCHVEFDRFILQNFGIFTPKCLK